MNLRRKILLPVIVALAFVILVFSFLLYRLYIEQQTIDQNIARIKLINKLSSKLSDLQFKGDFHTLLYKEEQDPIYLERISDASLEKSKVLDNIYSLIDTEKGKELAAVYIDSKRSVDQLHPELISSIQNNDTEGIRRNFIRWTTQAQNNQATLADLDVYNSESVQRSAETIKSIRQRIVQAILMILVLMILLIIFLYFYLDQIVTKPILALTGITKDISRARFLTATFDGFANDEIGHLAKDFEKMNEKLRKMYQNLEKKVKQRTKELDAVFNSSFQLTGLVSTKGVFMRVNQAVVDLFGFPADRYEGKLYWKAPTLIGYPDLQKKLKKAIFDAVKGKFSRFDVEIMSGERRVIVDYSVKPVFDEHKNVMFVVTEARDITERKISEESITLLNKRISKILDSISDGFISFDSDWRFSYLNKQAERIFPYKNESIFGKNLWETFPALVGTNLEKNYKRAMETQKKQTFKMRGSHGRTYQVHCYPASVGLSVYFTDITFEEEVAKRQEDFISIASHEIKSPVTTIGIYGELLDRTIRKNPNPKLLEFTTGLNNQIRQLKWLISDIFDMSSIQSGRLTLHKETVDMNELVSEAVKNAQRLSLHHIISLQGRAKKKITIDKIRIAQVMTNLLNNAIKYSPDANKIFVSIKEQKNELIISIKDLGVGIPKEKQDKIFTRYFRTRKGEKTATGLGLGLFIASNIILSHNGRIWVESEKGKGSTFSFSLPYKTE